MIAVNPIRRTLEDLFVELANQNGGGHGEPAQSGATMKTWIKAAGFALLVLARAGARKRRTKVENQSNGEI